LCVPASFDKGVAKVVQGIENIPTVLGQQFALVSQLQTSPGAVHQDAQPLLQGRGCRDRLYNQRLAVVFLMRRTSSLNLLLQDGQPLKVRGAGSLIFALTISPQAVPNLARSRPLLETVHLDLVPQFEPGQGRKRAL